jgi:DNA-binding LacI/PurR family transcriptional regulator
VALDYSALGHHLAAEATRLGHHHIAYITFDVVAASSQNTLHGLRQFTPKDGRTAQLTIIHDDVSLDVLRTAIHAAMAQESPPTLILVTEAVQALPVIGILKEMNLRIPEDVSLVVRDHEPCLERSVPEITRYNFDWLRFGRTVARLLSTMIESGGVKVIPRKLLPVFVPGQTLTRRRSV